MNNLEKRILTAIVALPTSIFLIVKGGYFLGFFLLFVLFIGMYELFSVFKKKQIILFLSIILILSLFSTYLLREEASSFLYFAVAISISSDIGGYVFGKIFKGKKLTKISPNKTVSGLFGSYLLSIICLFIYQYQFGNIFVEGQQLNIKIFLITIVFSTVAQAGDLTISYFKRLEKIKDTGKILPGHGGILDRIDGLMFVIILAYFLYYFKNIIL
tara:strand:+ start:157 stop:801 length:645 start_codon:yes stop_codon:yes gene_type:complete